MLPTSLKNTIQRASAEQMVEAFHRHIHITPSLNKVMDRGTWKTCRSIGRLLGLAHFYRRRAECEKILQCIQHALPGTSPARARQISRRSAQAQKIALCELLHLRTASAQELREHAVLEGVEHLYESRKYGNGAVLTTAHLGSFEVLGARVAQEFPFAAISNPYDSAVRQKHAHASRQSVGIHTFPGAGAARASVQALEKNHLLAIFMDLPGSTLDPCLPFLNQLRPTLSSPARLAMATCSPLIPIFAIRRQPWIADGRILIKVLPPLYLNYSVKRHSPEYYREILRGTRYATQAFEHIVQRYPEEWLLWATLCP